MDAQFSFMSGLSPSRLKEVMARFEGLGLTRELEEVDWVSRPGEFSERLSAHLGRPVRLPIFAQLPWSS